MIRAFFWVLVVFGLSAFAVVVANHEKMTPEQRTLVYGSAIVVCLAALAGGILYLFYRGVRTSAHIIFYLFCLAAVVFCLIHFWPALLKAGQHDF